jgi:hypothetical protein
MEITTCLWGKAVIYTVLIEAPQTYEGNFVG